MTTTSVKDVGSVLNSGIVPGGNTAKAVEESFQSVWNSQAGADRADAGQNDSAERAVTSKDDAAKPGDDLRAKDSARKDIGKEDTKAASEESKADELSEEELERIAEVAGTAAAELIQQIAETFGVSVEEVQNLMADMNLEAVDLLQSENLSNLLLQVSGAENTLALLTDEQLYSDFQMLMEQGKAALEQCSEATGMSAEELAQALEQLQADADGAESVLDELQVDEPVVEINTQDEGENDTFLQAKDAAQSQVQTAENAALAGSQTNDGAGNGENAQANAGNAGNLVLQTIQSENAQPQVAAAEAPVSVWSAETQDMMQQIMDYMRVQVKPDVSSLEMQLHPASLGTLQIHVASEGGVLTANFVTENETVKAAIESQMVQLKESFAEQGVKVDAIEVTVQTHQFEQNLEQGRERHPQGETSGAGRTRTRRINLSGLDGLELPEELDEEDQLTAEMMAANGQTVDYTA